uniref:PIN domain-containing protein n=1 Tax=Miniimonas arenae TaxID=676201 RepID=UPI0028ADE47A
MILVDSDVLIAHLRGVASARDWLRGAPADTLTVSAVTVAEVTGGMRESEERAVTALLGVLPTVPVTDPVARRAGALRRAF